MNGNSDKHKPLSPEELFGLLDSQNRDLLPDEELDDFEREALEGFSAHASVDDARRLTAEVQRSIDERIHKQPETRRKPKLLWFAAAASLALLVILSAYLLTTHTTESSNLALHQKSDNANTPLANEKLAEPSLEEVNAALPTSQTPQAVAEAASHSAEQPPVDASKVEESAKALRLESQQKGNAGPGAQRRKLSESDQQMNGDPAGTQESSVAREAKAAENVEASEAKVQISTKAIPQADLAYESVKDEAVSAFSTASSNVPAQTNGQVFTGVAGASVAANTVPQYKAYVNKTKNNLADKKSVAEGKVSKEKDDTNRNFPGPGALYSGGQQALKADVLNWLKAQAAALPVGEFHIRISVSAAGKAVVQELTPVGESSPAVLKALGEALISIKGWVPPVVNGKPADGEAVFTLKF